MAHHFYAQPVGPCAVCGRPATHLILGPGNEEYTKACDGHAEREVQRLYRGVGQERAQWPDDAMAAYRAALLKACYHIPLDGLDGVDRELVDADDAAACMARVAREAFRLGGLYYPPMDDAQIIAALTAAQEG